MKFSSYVITILLIITAQLNAHCQIPCGVYDDTMRVKMIEEHTLTILKSMNYISKNQNDLENKIKSRDGSLIKSSMHRKFKI